MSYSESVFFIPVSFNYKEFTQKITQSTQWIDTPEQKYMPSYFLNYVMNIAKDKQLFQSFSLKDISKLNLYMFEDKFDIQDIPTIKDIRCSCFSTGVGFLEFWVEYENTTPEKMANFSYRFKKAKVEMEDDDAKKCLYDVAKDILPDVCEAKLFFTAAAEFKYECQCYHFLHIDEAPEDQIADKNLFLLRRSYYTGFGMSNVSSTDMIYKPYDYDHWGGSSEGLVNITYDAQHNEKNSYLHKYKPMHLRIDYYFLYLLLLNQRFSCIQYITQVASVLNSNLNQIEELNKQIVNFKTVFAFNVVSDDQIFQSVYAEMYKILGIRHLLEDILDNENQIEVLRNASSVKAERLSNKFLFGLSLLSIFSALIDASSYFDRFDKLATVSNILGVVSTCLIIGICIVWIIKSSNLSNRKKR